MIVSYTNEDSTGTAVTDGHEDDALGALRYIMDAADGEPLFVLRGRDVLTVPVIKAYIDQCREHGARSQAERAWGHMHRFADWQRDNAKLTHMPDPIPDDTRHRESRA